MEGCSREARIRALQRKIVFTKNKIIEVDLKDPEWEEKRRNNTLLTIDIYQYKKRIGNLERRLPEYGIGFADLKKPKD